MNLKNSGDSTGFEPMTSAMPVQCSNQLSYEVTQLRAGQLVGLMFSRERNVVWKKCYMKCGVWNQLKIWSSHLLDNLSNCLMNLKNSGDSTGFEPMTSAMPVQCSNQLSYEVTQLRAGQLVGLMFSRERNVVWKKCYMKCGVWNQLKIWSSHLLDNLSNCLMNLKNSGDSTMLPIQWVLHHQFTNSTSTPSTSKEVEGENVNPEATTHATTNTHTNITNTQNDGGPVSTRAQYTKPRLPKLTLFKFKGDVTKWNSFWDSLKSTVHDDKGMLKIDKFNYLNSLLEGTALRAIQGLPIIEQNYDHAVASLNERFGRPKQIISAHMDEIMKISSATGDRTAPLRFIYDKVSVHVA